MADSANKSTVISGLVQQLKAGEITKSELFEKTFDLELQLELPERAVYESSPPAE